MGHPDQIEPGVILHGPMEGVDHSKFYIVAGISGDKVLACSVLINSRINPYIANRPHLMRRQILIQQADYTFLDHDSYINCASPLKGNVSIFYKQDYTIKGHLSALHLREVRKQIISSGILSVKEMEKFGLKDW